MNSRSERRQKRICAPSNLFRTCMTLYSVVFISAADVDVRKRSCINLRKRLTASATRTIDDIHSRRFCGAMIDITRSKILERTNDDLMLATTLPQPFDEPSIEHNYTDFHGKEFEDDFTEEHPLRMALWKVNLRLGMARSADSIQFYFNRSGKVSMHDGSGVTGEWWFDQGGISWDMDITDVDNNAKKTTYHYHADIHMNKFGERPRMYKGVVTRDRYKNSFLPPSLFRPVIATFSAQGVGKDTRDTTYKNRLLGEGYNNYSIMPKSASFDEDEDW